MKTTLQNITRLMIITAAFTLSACTVETSDLSEQVGMVKATSSSTPVTSSIISSGASSTSESGRLGNASWIGFTRLWSTSKKSANTSTNSQIIVNSTAAKAAAEQEAQVHQEALIVEQATAKADHETGAAKER